MAQIELKNINKTFDQKEIFHNFDLSIEKGEFLGIKGESGKGKTTLLNMIGLMEPCEGTITFDGEEISAKDSKKVRKLHREKVGYLFQNFALIDDISVYDNLRIVLGRSSKKEKRERMMKELSKVGFDESVLDKKIFQLSGGEQQRIAAVRLMLKESEIILADEPTGSLDERNSKIIMELLKKLNEEKKTIIMVSHDERTFPYCTRVITL